MALRALAFAAFLTTAVCAPRVEAVTDEPHVSPPVVATSDADVLARLKPHLSLRRTAAFNVRDAGARGDGVAYDTDAIAACIGAVSQNGNGIVYFPPGTYLTAPFNLTSHVTLYLETGSTLLAAPHGYGEWPLVAPLPSYGQGREMPGPRYQALVSGSELSDVVIVGVNATINGNGESWWHVHKQKLLSFTRPHVIELMHANSVAISGLRVVNSPFWAVHLFDTHDAVLSELVVQNPIESFNASALVLDSSSDVLVEKSLFAVGSGDGCAVKSGWDAYGEGYQHPCEDVLVRELEVHALRGAAFLIGDEMSGGVKNITVSRSVAAESAVALRVASAPGRGGVVSDVSFENVSVDRAQIAIQVIVAPSEHAAKFNESHAPQLADVSFVNITAARGRLAVELRGAAEAPLKKIKLVRCRFEGFRDMFACENVSGTMQDVLPEGDSCVGMRKLLSDELKSKVTASTASAKTAASLDNAVRYGVLVGVGG
jgi:polygalacturonase